MVSITIIVTGVRFWGTVFLGLSTSLSLPSSSDMAYTSSVHVSNMGDSFSIFGAFLVEPRLKLVLQWSVFIKLDNCLLHVNPNLYHTISWSLVLKVLCLGSTSADRQLSKSNRFLSGVPILFFMMSLRLASLDVSPHLRSMSVLFSFFLEQEGSLICLNGQLLTMC